MVSEHKATFAVSEFVHEIFLFLLLECSWCTDDRF